MIKIHKILLIIFAYFLSFIGSSQCHYTIDMQDSFGDGWNGASVLVEFVGPVDIAPITLDLPAGYSGSQRYGIVPWSGDVLIMSRFPVKLTPLN